MKDPLQAEQTPYEILGLERGASAADIDNAFKMGLVKRGNVQKLTAAKLALQRPAERALLDVFQYDPQVLSRLKPNPLEQPAALEAANRAATAAAWENALRANFPDSGIVHCLAVLGYWQAVHEEERVAAPSASAGAGGGAAVAPARQAAASRQQLWQRVIGCWAMLASADEFWERQAGVPANLVSEVRNNAVERLRNRLQDLAQRRRAANSADATLYQELELALTTELRTARDVGAAGLKTARGRVACGPLMLRRMGILDNIRTQVENALRASPSNARLQSLRDALSPYASIGVLIEQKKPQAALEAIEALPAAERGSPEVSRLHVRALHETAKQLASLGKYDEALEHWRDALDLDPDEAMAGEIRAELVSTCQTRANALPSQKRDEAISLLEEATDIVDDEKLRLTLGELLTNRGIETFMEAQKTAEREKRGPTRDLIAAFERGLADLERAATLGSKRGAEQAAIARRVVSQIRSGYADIPDRAQESAAKANEAAARDDWDGAVKHLREAIYAAGNKAPEAMKKNLSVCLANRAVATANRAVQTLSEAGQQRNKMMEMLQEQLSRARSDSACALCGKARYSYSDESWFSMNLSGGGTATLCASCVAIVRSATESAPGPPAESVSGLRSALSDLDESLKLDPGNEAARKHRSDIKDILDKLGPAAAAAAAAPRFPSGAPARPKAKAPASASSDRHTLHAIFVGAMVVFAWIAFLVIVPSKADSQWQVAARLWAIKVRLFSPMGKIAYYLAWPLGILESICVFTAGITTIPVGYLLGVVCGTRWRNKDAFAKFYELVLWVFTLSALAALAAYFSR